MKTKVKRDNVSRKTFFAVLPDGSKFEMKLEMTLADGSYQIAKNCVEHFEITRKRHDKNRFQEVSTHYEKYENDYVVQIPIKKERIELPNQDSNEKHLELQINGICKDVPYHFHSIIQKILDDHIFQDDDSKLEKYKEYANLFEEACEEYKRDIESEYINNPD